MEPENDTFIISIHSRDSAEGPEDKNVLAKILGVAPPSEYDYKDGPLFFEGEEPPTEGPEEEADQGIEMLWPEEGD